jgi:hypothetical protein
MTNSGGKSPRPTGARALVQTRQAFLKETLAPHGNDFATGIQTGPNLIIAPTLGGQQDDFGPNDLKIR